MPQLCGAKLVNNAKREWPKHPFRLSPDQQPFTLLNSELNIAFRFGVERSGKLRACDDLRHAKANMACIVETPIKIARWDHLSELSNRVNDRARDRAFFKADREAAYKQLPLDPRHTKLAVIAPGPQLKTNGMAS